MANGDTKSCFKSCFSSPAAAADPGCASSGGHTATTLQALRTGIWPQAYTLAFHLCVTPVGRKKASETPPRFPSSSSRCTKRIWKSGL